LNVLYGSAYGSTSTLPAQERYFIGGINTIRGFKNFTISPKDPTTEGLTGGNQAWWVNNEILFPLYEQLRMRGLVFFDAGNNLNENYYFADLFRTRIYTAAGVGIRFQSPFGNIRLEWGFNLNPHEGEKSQVLGFTAGSSF
jgi:outer membrane protein insertion porin family